MTAPDICDQTIENYLRVFIQDLPGTLTLWCKKTKNHHFFDTDDVASAALFAKMAAERGEDVYVRANLQADALGTKADTVGYLTTLTLDFDVAGPGHKGDGLPGSLTDLDTLLSSAGYPEPTVTLLTGGGGLCVWALEEPIRITTPEERQAAKETSKRFQETLSQHARVLGFNVDKTYDLVRACRIPFTRNMKPEYGSDGVQVAVRNWGGHLLTECELKAALVKWEDPKAGIAAKRAASPRAGMPKAGPSDLPSWEAIYSGCDVLRNWADTKQGLPENQWYAMASIVGCCDEGAATFHRLSSEDSRYSARETEEKLAHALEASGPRTCEGLNGLGGDCRNCPFEGEVHSPIVLGKSSPAVSKLARRWVYVISQDAFLDLGGLGDSL